MRFEDIGLSKELLKAVADMGFEEPSPIQVLAIPVILEGRDVVGQAQTGTGKTAAYGLPILEKIDPRQRQPQALVLCPTRELAIQVAEEMAKFGGNRRKISILPIYGGQPIDRQFRALDKGAQVIVGTPGRIMDHMERGSLVLQGVNVAVLDEADEMLDMGFREDIEHILEHTPSDSQRIMFSATMPHAIMELARKFLNDPEIVKISHKVVTVPSIEQTYYEVRPHQKMEALCRVLDSSGFHKTLVFCSTKRAVDELTAHLSARGYQVDGLHGNLVQAQRDRVMGRFRTGGIDILVATDVAARGIDVDDVEAVINFDIPNDVENYVHRIGRTGRAGRAGSAFTFVTAREHYRLRDIMRYTKARITQSHLPTLRDVVNIKTARLLDEVREVLENESLDRHVALVESFLDEEGTSMEMAAALLKMLMQREFGIADTEKDALAEPPSRKAESRSPRQDSRFAKDDRPRGKDKFAKRDAEQAMVRLFFNVGSKMNVGPRDLVGAIAGESGIPGRIIGAIEIHDRFSFVDVPSSVAEDVLTVMNGCQIRGYTVSADKAMPKK